MTLGAHSSQQIMYFAQYMYGMWCMNNSVVVRTTYESGKKKVVTTGMKTRIASTLHCNMHT